MTSTPIIVPGSGPQPSPWMVIGERPGFVESRTGRPFTGPSGDEHRRYLHTFGLDARDFRLDNAVRSYHPDNATPTAADVLEWAPTLEEEIRATRPRMIIAAGATAARALLGPCDLDAVTGLPHHGGAFDPAIAQRACGAVVVPIYHPARGLHDDGFRPMVSSRYEMAAGLVKRVARGLPVEFPWDRYAGCESYQDVSGRDLATILAVESPPVLGLDTEGTPDAPWSVQVSTAPGTGYLLRVSRPDFAEGIAQLQHLADHGAVFCMHQASAPDFSFYDMVMCRAMGLELRYARIWDSMYAAYLRRIEPQGLKALSYRKHGMRMAAYEDLLSGIGRDRQVDWLLGVMSRRWPDPEPQMIRDGDGTWKLYRPEAPHKAAKRIVSDVWDGKVNKEGEPVDPHKRWKNLDRSVRRMVALVPEFGRMPVATLDDVPLEQAVHYGCMDADSPLRSFYSVGRELEEHGLAGLMAKGMAVMGFFEEMQAAGMPGSHSRFLALLDRLYGELDVLHHRITAEHCGGRPFKPNSADHVLALMDERGLSSTRKTKTGKRSTAKKDIGHLKFTDEAMFDVFQYRERSKLIGTFVEPITRGMEERAAASPGVDNFPVHTNMKITRVITRRPASSKAKSGDGDAVNLLNIPKRTKHGKMVRQCYVAPEGHVFVRADWSQCQMRLMADECRDPLLIALYREGRDVYVETAAMAETRSRGREVPTSAITDDLRQAFKTACLGTIFGLQALGLRDQLWNLGEQYKRWTADDCQGLLDSILVTYPGIPAFFGKVERELRGSAQCPNPHGEIRDRFGLPRYLPGIHSDDRKVSSAAVREAVNFKCQAGEAGMMYNVIEYLRPVMREAQEAGIEVVPRLEIYDSLDFTCPDWYAETWAGMLYDAMVGHHGVELAVPIKADVGIAEVWSDL